MQNTYMHKPKLNSGLRHL